MVHKKQSATWSYNDDIFTAPSPSTAPGTLRLRSAVGPEGGSGWKQIWRTLIGQVRINPFLLLVIMNEWIPTPTPVQNFWRHQTVFPARDIGSKDDLYESELFLSQFGLNRRFFSFMRTCSMVWITTCLLPPPPSIPISQPMLLIRFYEWKGREARGEGWE